MRWIDKVVPAVLVAGVMMTMVTAPNMAFAVRCTKTGTSGNDVLTGTMGDDVICGLGGNDFIPGVRGDDTLLGGQGAG
jgi:RTX calcium-binding nonapeptide repeat (4 copies)